MKFIVWGFFSQRIQSKMQNQKFAGETRINMYTQLSTTKNFTFKIKKLQ